MALDTGFLAAHFRHLSGRETTAEELMTVGARVWNLGRLVNLRERLRGDDDRLPARILETPHTDGGAAGKVPGAAPFTAALDEYYALRGWDADGIPTERTLRRLGFDDLDLGKD
jgi:aldehyde:ferredoxin oxidoreductase